MLGIFGWLRRRTAEAVLAGLNDAVEAMAGDESEGAAAIALPESLARRLTLALPAAEARQEAEGDGGALVPVPSRNGSGRKAK
jgi:hypothetical protein